MAKIQPLPIVFERYVGDCLSNEPALKHEWVKSPSNARLVIPRASESGFTIETQAETYGLYVSAEGWHSGPWELVNGEKTEELCSQFFGFLRTLLSGDAWLEVWSAGMRPYKWIMTYGVEGGVETESTGSLFYNYLGHRSVRVLQNEHLPVRYGVKRSS